MPPRLTRLQPHEIAVIIPARLASQRLPGKPLAMIGDTPMIAHVLHRAREAGFGGEDSPRPGGAPRLVVACDDEAIAAAVRDAGGEAVMTRADHPSGSDRIFEALETIDPEARIRVVINLQGDLPEIDAGILWPLADAVAAGKADIATPVTEATDEEAVRPSVVKAAITFPEDAPRDSRGQIMAGAVGDVSAFAREVIRQGDEKTPAQIWHHIGIYAMRRDALARFVALPPSPLEKAERLEQLRALEDGMRIAALVVDSAPAGIDTPQDLAAAQHRFTQKQKGT